MRCQNRERPGEEYIDLVRGQESRKRQKILNEEKTGRTRSALRHTKYFTERPAHNYYLSRF